MTEQVIAALIGGLSTIIVGILGYFGHKVSAALTGVHTRIDRVEGKIDRLDAKIDRAADAYDGRIESLNQIQSNVRERLARVEALERPAEPPKVWEPVEGNS